jgi:hypothetical protein
VARVVDFMATMMNTLSVANEHFVVCLKGLEAVR